MNQAAAELLQGLPQNMTPNVQIFQQNYNFFYPSHESAFEAASQARKKLIKLAYRLRNENAKAKEIRYLKLKKVTRVTSPDISEPKAKRKIRIIQKTAK